MTDTFKNDGIIDVPPNMNELHYMCNVLFKSFDRVSDNYYLSDIFFNLKIILMLYDIY